MNKCVWLTIVALDKAKALHGIEELNRTRRAFAGQCPLNAGRTVTKAATAAAAFAAEPVLTRCALFHWQGITLNDEIRGGNLSAPINQCIAKWLTFSEASKACLLNRADVHKHIFSAAILNDEAKAFLRVKEFNDALAFADHLSWHLRTWCAETATTAAAATAETITAAAKAIAATGTVTAATETAAAETITAAAAEAAIKFTEIFALIKAATAALSAPPSIKTHPSNNFLRNRVRPDITRSGRWTNATEI